MSLNLVRTVRVSGVLKLVVTLAVALVVLFVAAHPAAAIDYDKAHPSAPEYVGYGRVHTTGGAPLRLRSAPHTGSNSQVIDKIRNGAVIKYRCWLQAETVDGPYGPSNIWYGTRRGFLPQAYLRWNVPGGTPGSAPRCGGQPLSMSTDGAKHLDECSLGGSQHEIYELFFGHSCVAPDEVTSPDPGDPAFPSSFAGQRPHFIMNIGPDFEDSLGLVWDGCSVPWQAVLLPGMGDDVSAPFGFNFRKACQVHDLGYRLMDRHILPESAEAALDSYFGQMLGRICLTQHRDRLVGCREAALAYASAVNAADHQPKPDDYPRFYVKP